MYFYALKPLMYAAIYLISSRLRGNIRLHGILLIKL